MRIVVNRDDLKATLAAPAQIASKSSIPVLRTIKITASDIVTIEATDLVTSVKQIAQTALVDSPGSALLPAKKIESVVKALPDQSVLIDVTGDVATISSGEVTVTAHALNPQDFPSFQEIESTCTASVDLASFDRIVKAVLPAVAKKNAQIPILEGISMSIKENELCLIATDSYRVHKGCATVSAQGSCNVAIPPDALTYILSCAFGSVEIAANDKQAQISSNGQTITTVVIEGNFPNAQQFFSASYENRAVFDALQIKASIKRALTIGAGERVRVCISDNTAQITCVSDDEQYSENLPCECSTPLEIIQNPSYLSAAISAIDSDEIVLEVNASNAMTHLLGNQIECCVAGVRA